MNMQSERLVRKVVSSLFELFSSTPDAIVYTCNTRTLTGHIVGNPPGPVAIHGKVYSGPPTDQIPGSGGLFNRIPWNPSVSTGNFDLGSNAGWPNSGSVTARVWLEHQSFVHGDGTANCGGGSGEMGEETPPEFAIAPKTYILEQVPGVETSSQQAKILKPGLKLVHHKSRWTATSGKAELTLVLERTGCGQLRGRLTVEAPGAKPSKRTWESGLPWDVSGVNVLTSKESDDPRFLLIRAGE